MPGWCWRCCGACCSGRPSQWRSSRSCSRSVTGATCPEGRGERPPACRSGVLSCARGAHDDDAQRVVVLPSEVRAPGRGRRAREATTAAALDRPGLHLARRDEKPAKALRAHALLVGSWCRSHPATIARGVCDFNEPNGWPNLARRPGRLCGARHRVPPKRPRDPRPAPSSYPEPPRRHPRGRCCGRVTDGSARSRATPTGRSRIP
jgi:hypothetical protein